MFDETAPNTLLHEVRRPVHLLVGGLVLLTAPIVLLAKLEAPSSPATCASNHSLVRHLYDLSLIHI